MMVADDGLLGASNYRARRFGLGLGIGLSTVVYDGLQSCTVLALDLTVFAALGNGSGVWHVILRSVPSNRFNLW